MKDLQVIFIEQQEQLDQAATIANQVFFSQVLPSYGPKAFGAMARYCATKADRLEEYSRHGVQYTAAAYSKKNMVGMVSFDKQGVVRLLYVKQQFQHHGVGERLLSFAEQQLKQAGLPWVYVDAALGAVPFYKKHGYQQTDFTCDKEGIVFLPMKKQIKKG